MSRPRRMLAALILLLVGATVAAGCGETMISQDEMTANIKKQYKEQTGLTLTKLECDDVKAEKGAEISCRATNSGDVAMKITGEVTGEESASDKWGFRWSVTERDAPGTIFADSAAETIKAKFGVPVKSVVCPERIKVVSGAEVHCEATATDGSSRGITLRLTDNEGGMRVIVDKD